MSVTQKVLALVSGLPSGKARMDVASTINFLFGLYMDGRINEDQLRNDLYDICREVISMSYPELLEDEVRKRASMVADDLVKAMKVEGMAKRKISMIASAYRIPP